MVLPPLLLLQRPLPHFDAALLVDRYRLYRLPTPPANAKPVLYTDESSVQIVGFRAPGAAASAITTPWDPIGYIPSGWTPAVENLATAPIRDLRADDTFWPSIAILETRGQHGLAQKCIRAAFSDKKPDNSDYLDPLPWLRYSAWGYWRNRAIIHPVERRTIEKWLRSLPLKDKIDFSAAEVSFLKDLNATLWPVRKNWPTNRFDDLMDQMVTAKGEIFMDLHYGPTRQDEIDDLALPFRKLWDAGFDAVPTLFRYLEDRRITLLGSPRRSGRPTDAGRHFYHRVCDVAADLIRVEVEGYSDYYSNELREPIGHYHDGAPDKQIEDVKAMWGAWLALKKRGERQEMFSRLKEFDEFEKGTLSTVETEGSRAYPLRVLAKKYLNDLRKFLKHVKFSEERVQIKQALIHP